MLALPVIPDLRPLSRRVINATSLFHGPHSIFAKKISVLQRSLEPTANRVDLAMSELLPLFP
jgi:hypothetical protein